MPLVRRRRLIRRRKAPRRGLRKSRLGRMKRPMNANKDFATVTEVTERVIGAQEGNFITHCLADFARASTVAQQYRFYRCKKVELEFVPYANLFTPGTGMPELYTQVDRTGGLINGASLPLPTKGFMEAKGCMPQKWTSIIKRFYVPSVLRNENLYIQRRLVADVSGGIQPLAPQSVINNIAAVSSTPVFNKWYMVQHYGTPVTASQNPAVNYPHQAEPSIDSMSLQWYGMNYFAEAPVAGGPTNIGKVVIKVHWQFKQPLWPPDTGITGSYQTGGEGWNYNSATSPN